MTDPGLHRKLCVGFCMQETLNKLTWSTLDKILRFHTLNYPPNFLFCYSRNLYEVLKFIEPLFRAPV
jgi:hypothetical protein